MAMNMTHGQSQLLCAVRELACYRGGRMLFSGLELAISAGELLWLRGPNAIGKSSLLRIIAGLLPHSAGHRDVPAGIALIDDDIALDADSSVHAALSFWAGLDNRPDQIAAAMAAMGIAHLADVPMRFLSQGQRKRAGMARVIASGAPLWLLDEPANGLDVHGVSQLCAAIAAHRADRGAVLLASHIDLHLPDTRIIDIADFVCAEDANIAVFAQ